MSVYAGPNISTNSLVLSVDSANTKSYATRPGTRDHGISDWYCFATATVIYSTSEPDTIIYQRTDTGVISIVVANSNIPSRGQITCYVGYFYYGNKPINLVPEDFQHAIAPISMAGTLFIYVANRAGNETGTVYFYSPFGTTTVTQYTQTGILGTATGTLSLTANQQGIFSTTTINWFWYTSTLPVIASATQISADKTILSPAMLTSYQRFQNLYATSVASTPTTMGNYVIADTTYPVISQSIADGSGGDTAQGLGYEYLCDRYSWGNVCSDYVVVAPDANTQITTSYWSGTAWVIWDVHSLSGTMLNPAGASRDGTSGPGVTATLISGTTTNMAAGATLWKWEGNNPFYLCINDSTDDEFSVLGWMNSRNIRLTSDRDTNLYDVSIFANTGTLYNGIIKSVNGLSLQYANSMYVEFANTSNLQFLNRVNFTCEAWVYPTRNPGANYYSGIITRESNPGSGRDGYNLYFNGSATTTTYFTFERFYSGTGSQASLTIDSSLSVNKWSHLVATYNGTSISLYRNGVLVATGSSPGDMTNTVKATRIGSLGNAYFFDGKISKVQLYNRALSVSEVAQNFNALRGRFDL